MTGSAKQSIIYTTRKLDCFVALLLAMTASHRPVGLHAGGHVDAELDLADRLDDVVAEQLREAGIAPIVHVQAVGDDKTVDRERLLLMPVAHHLEARENADVTQRCDPAEHLHHLACALGAL